MHPPGFHPYIVSVPCVSSLVSPHNRHERPPIGDATYSQDHALILGRCNAGRVSTGLHRTVRQKARAGLADDRARSYNNLAPRANSAKDNTTDGPLSLEMHIDSTILDHRSQFVKPPKGI